MPNETKQAVEWALQQEVESPFGLIQVTKEYKQLLVDKVREYFNENSIEYSSFSYSDLEPYL